MLEAMKKRGNEMAVKTSHQVEWKKYKFDFICIKSNSGTSIQLDGSEEFFSISCPRAMSFARVFDDAGISEYFNALDDALNCFEFDAIRAIEKKQYVEAEMAKFVAAVKEVIGE